MNKDLFIKSFSIKRLFGSYNVVINFKYNINIFVGENGLGKTTILNILNYVLQGDSESLAAIDFQEIQLVLGDDSFISILHEDLIKEEFEEYNYKYNKYIRNYSSHNYIFGEKKFFLDLLKMDDEELKMIREGNLENFTNFVNKNIKYDFSPLMVERLYDVFNNNKDFIKQLENSWEYKIHNYMKKRGNIIYLPTYRRIEEDFNSFIDSRDEDAYYRKKNKKHNLKYLQFGMDDVQKLIISTCSELRNNTNEGFKEMTSNLLTKYITIFKERDLSELNIKQSISGDTLNIVFSRLADKIDGTIKNELFDLIGNPKVTGKDSLYIFSILSELVSIYEKNQSIDESLEKFKDVCNKYLVNNEIEYDKFKIECSVRQKHNGKSINLKNLSSGEKQIISLFSKLYLTKNESNVILFDEPELSLSIIWQKRLLPDILDTKRCSFIIAITHSPFIFDNELSKYAMDIQRCIKPVDEKN